MTKIFISHSSKDKEFVRQLAEDLLKMGVKPWLDEWEIKVGECIVTKVEQGIADADYVAIVLSPHSVKSGWVEREWRSKYWDEISSGKTAVLPLLAEQCEVPQLLKTKKYANFAANYAVALVELMAAIAPTMPSGKIYPVVSVPGYSSDLSNLLGKIQGRTQSLSECITEALLIAQKAKNPSLERFCRSELGGWEKIDSADEANHRLVDVYASFNRINLAYVGWGGDLHAILGHMRSNPQTFFPSKLIVPEAIATIESRANSTAKGLATKTLPAASVLQHVDPKHADLPMNIYASGDCFARVLDAVRSELTKQLLDILPRIDSPGVDG